jgi:hypothetical protein
LTIDGVAWLELLVAADVAWLGLLVAAMAGVAAAATTVISPSATAAPVSAVLLRLSRSLFM